MDKGVREGRGSPGGGDRPGGFVGSPGGAASGAVAGSGDKGTAPSDTEGAKSCTADVASDSTPPGVPGRDVSATDGTCSLCFSAFALDAERVAALPAGVGGREEETKEDVLVVLRSRPDVIVGAVPVTVLEPERCGRVVLAGRRVA